MPRYSRDPYWLTARFASTCAGKGCNDPIKKGDRIFFYPIGKHAYVGPCADAASRDFETCVFNEEMYG